MAEEVKSFISKVKLPSGSEYYFKDEVARELIEGLGSPIQFRGKATTQVTDQGIQNPNIEGYDFTNAKAKGDIVAWNKKEFIWDGEKWLEFGDLSDLGEFAYANEGEINYTPKGKVDTTIGAVTGTVTTTVSTPEGTISDIEFTGTNKNVVGTATVEGSISANFTGGAVEASGSFVPAGTITQPEFKGESSSFTGTATISGDIQASFTGEDLTSTGSFVPAGTIEDITPSGSVEITPTKKAFVTSITAPTVNSTFEGQATQISAQTTAHVFTATVESETLTLSTALGTVTGTATASGTIENSVTNGTATTEEAVVSATATFEGKDITPVFKGTSDTVTVKGKPTGSVSATLEDSTADVTVTGVPKGTVTTPTFSGSNQTVNVTGTATGNISATLQEASANVNIPYTPTGNVSQPTFEGTAQTVKSILSVDTVTAISTFTGENEDLTITPKD